MVLDQSERNVCLRASRFRGRLPSQDRRDQSAAGKGRESRACSVTIKEKGGVSRRRPRHRSKAETSFKEAGQMALTRGSFGGYQFERMVVLFSMVDGQREIQCAISTSAMDDLEKPERTKSDQREAQFLRLRDQIEERAACKFLAREFEGTPPGIILRSLDFRDRR